MDSASESFSSASTASYASSDYTSTTTAGSSETGAEFEEGGKPVASNVSIVTPVVYVTVLLITFVIFSILYRRRELSKLQNMRPVFNENVSKEMYEELKAQDDPKVNDKVLKAALIRRGGEAIRRMFKLKETEPFVNQLYMKGYIGDDDHERFKIQSKLQELEMNELAQEAESYKKGWAQTFFPVCQESMLNEALRRRVNAFDDRKEKFSKEWIDVASGTAAE